MRAKRFSLLLVLFCLINLSSHAQNEDNSILRGSLWVIAAVHQDAHQDKSSDNYKSSSLLRFLEATFQQTPTMPLSKLRQQTDLGVAILDNVLLPSDAAALEVARSYFHQSAPVALRPFVELAQDAAVSLDRTSATTSNAETESDIYLQSLDSRRTFAEAYRLSIMYPKTFGEILNHDMVPRFLRAQTTSSISTLNTLYPFLNTTIDPNIATLVIPGTNRQDAAQTLITAHLATYRSQLRIEMQAFNKNLPANHGATSSDTAHNAASTGGNSTPTAQPTSSPTVQDVKKEFSDEQDMVGIISTILQLSGDKKLDAFAKSFEKQATAMISFTATLATYMNGGAVSVFALAHSGLTAALDIAWLVGGDVSPDAAVLAEIQQDLKELQQDMIAHFAALDLEIDQLFFSLDRIYQSIQNISLQVDELQRQVSLTNERLQSLIDRNGILAAAQADDAFETEKEHCLLYEYSPGLPQSDFVYCMDAFAARSTVSASNEIYEPLWSRDESEYAIAAELNKPLAYNLRYLNAVLADQGIGFQVPQLPNPSVWTSGADAYVDIATKYPNFFYQLTAIDKLKRIASEETSLQEFIRQITGTTAEERHKTFHDGLIKAYDTAARSLGKTLDDRRSQIIQYQLMQLPEAAALKAKSMGGCPWTLYPSGPPRWDALSRSVDLPLDPLTSRVVPAEYLIVEQNNLGDLTVCYNTVSVSDSRPEDTEGISWVSYNVRMQIAVLLGEKVLFSDDFVFRGHYAPILDNALLWNWVQIPPMQHLHTDFMDWLQKKLEDPSAIQAARNYAVEKLWKKTDFVSGVIATLAGEMSSSGSSLYETAESLSGKKMLLKNAAAVAFPLTYQSSPELETILGENGLVAHDAILRAYACIEDPKFKCAPPDRNFADELIKNPIDAHQVAIQRVWNKYSTPLEGIIDNAPYDELEPSLRATSFKLKTLILLYEGTHPAQIQAEVK